MPNIPEYLIVGSEVGTGDLDMIDGGPVQIVGVRLVLKPLDSDGEETFPIIGILGREDVDVLVRSLILEAVKVPYIAEQMDKEDNDRNA